MKFRVKMLYLVTFMMFILAVAALSVLTFMPPARKTWSLRELPAIPVFKDWAKPQPGIQLQRHTALLADDPASAAGRPGYDELSERIFKTAGTVISAVLPPGSAFIPDNTLNLRNGNCAEVTGTAAVPGSSTRTEQHFRCRVKVYFLPNGSCEAAFPEFTPVTP